MWFIFAILHYRKVQDKAQEELDKVVGRSRMPSFTDFKHLPYIRAIVKEVFCFVLFFLTESLMTSI